MYQKECFFDEKVETFSSTYKMLNDEIVKLFQKHWKDTKCERYVLKDHIGIGSYHNSKQLGELQRKIHFD